MIIEIIVIIVIILIIEILEIIEINEIITGKFYSRGIIFRVSTNILNIAPPLCITRDEVDEICTVIDEVLTELANELGI